MSGLLLSMRVLQPMLCKHQCEVGWGDVGASTSIAASLADAIRPPSATAGAGGSGRRLSEVGVDAAFQTGLRTSIMGVLSNNAAASVEDPSLIKQSASTVGSVVSGDCEPGALDSGSEVIATGIAGAGTSGLEDGAAEQMLGAMGSMLAQGAAQAATLEADLNSTNATGGRRLSELANGTIVNLNNATNPMAAQAARELDGCATLA